MALCNLSTSNREERNAVSMPLTLGKAAVDADMEGPETAEDAEVMVAVEAEEEEEMTITITTST